MIKSREQLLQDGWGQGVFVNLEMEGLVFNELPEISKSIINGESYLVPLLYDCALLSEDFNVEPWVQCVLLTPCGFDPSYAHARNPRKYHFPLLVEGAELFFEASSVGVLQLQRQVLLEGTLNQKVNWPANGLERLRNWVTRRINMPVFPDEWNERIRPQEKRFKKLWKNNVFKDHCSEVLIQLSDDRDLSAEEVYTVNIFVILPYEGGQGRHVSKLFKESQNNQDALLMKLKACFDSCDGIVVGKIETYFEDQVTLQIQREFKSWSLENYSYQVDPEGVLPAGIF